MGNRKIYLNFRNCQSYQVANEEVQSSVVEDFCCSSYEEANTKIIYHACNFTVVIRASDTDILVIMIGNMAQMKNSHSNIWMLNGTGNNERYINVTKLYCELGQLLAKSLIGFHAFTGCDFNPAFVLIKEKRDLILC